MALDESSLEAMLARQKGLEDREPHETTLTDVTDEFEVYERAPAEEEAPTEQEAASQEEPTAPVAAPAAAPPQAQPERDVVTDAATPPSPEKALPSAPAADTAPEEAARPARDSPSPEAPAMDTPAPTVPAEPAETEASAPLADGETAAPASPQLENVPVQNTLQPSIFHPTELEEAPIEQAPEAPTSEAVAADALADATEPTGDAPVQATAVDAQEEATDEAAAAAMPSDDAPAAEPRPSHGATPRVAIVQSDYHAKITHLMTQWAREQVEEDGGEVADEWHVAGAYDIPLACKTLAARGDVDAVIAIGCIIQGETAHDEVIAHAAAQALQTVALETGKPVGFAISGPRMTQEQAEARIVMGRNAARSVMAQLRLLA